MALRQLLQQGKLVLDELVDAARAPRATAPRLLRALQLSELEERVMLSATPVAVVALDADPGVDPAESDLTALFDTFNADSDTADAVPRTELLDLLADNVLPPQVDQRIVSELVFIDASADDYERLVADLENSDTAREFDVVVLDSDRNGIAQITNALADYQGVEAIHIVSHGNTSGVQLGNTWLGGDNLSLYQSAIGGWNNSLANDCDILFYGCRLAGSQDGQQLLNDISHLTGADVAASIDNTGHASLGGDWVFEYSFGVVETDVAFSTVIQQNWLGLLDTTTGLLGHWTADLDGADSSGNGRDGTLAGNAAIDSNTATNIAGLGKLALDGTNDYLDLSAYSATLGTLSQGTIAGWIQTSQASGSQTLFGVADHAEGFSFSTLGVYNGRLFFDVAEGGYLFNSYTDASVADGSWHHVAVTVDGSGNSLYIDGAKVAAANINYGPGDSASSTYFLDDVDDVDVVHIGVTGESGGYAYDFNGLIDDVRVYNRALSAADIAELHANSPTPQLDYSTFLGGSLGESISSTAVHSSGDVFIVGRTQSANMPTTVGALDTTYSGASDLYVARLSPDGNGSADLVYLTYLGGSGNEYGGSVQVDAAGNAYVGGATTSGDFTTTVGAYDTVLGGTQDSFVVKIDPTGSTLLYSTYYGGDAGSESGPDLVLDDSGRVYISGQTRSGDLPTVNAYDSTMAGVSDSYIARLSADGSTLEYSTFIGGSTGNDGGGNITVDSSGLIYFANYTYSADFQTTVGAFSTAIKGTRDAVLSIIDPSLGAAGLLYSTYFGGGGGEGFSDVEVDSSGNVYLLASTDSGDLPTTVGAYDTTFGGLDDLAVVKIDPSGNGASDLLYSTYIGGAGDEDAGNIVLDGDDDVVFVGTAEDGFPVVFPIQGTHAGGVDDAIVGRISLDGAGSDDLQFASYVGGTGAESGYNIAVNDAGDVYVIGRSNSSDYPTTAGAYDTTANGDYDNFITKFTGIAAATISNNAPTISGIANQSTAEDTSTGPVAFTIGDVETAAGSLIVTASSDDQTLIPDANITLGGSGANRTIDILPGLNQSGGPATITVTVDDGTTTTQTTFDISVTSGKRCTVDN